MALPAKPKRKPEIMRIPFGLSLNGLSAVAVGHSLPDFSVFGIGHPSPGSSSFTSRPPLVFAYDYDACCNGDKLTNLLTNHSINNKPPILWQLPRSPPLQSVSVAIGNPFKQTQHVINNYTYWTRLGISPLDWRLANGTPYCHCHCRRSGGSSGSAGALPRWNFNVQWPPQITHFPFHRRD